MQDPRSTDLDKSFLESMGCELVDHPEAFQHVNQKSLVYAIHCAFRLIWEVKERANPALLICNNLRNSRFEQVEYKPDIPGQPEDKLEILEQSGEKGVTYMDRYEKTRSSTQDCEEIAFPELRNDFSDTVIYRRCSQRPTNSQEALAMETS
jgi:hypothetical protein